MSEKTRKVLIIILIIITVVLALLIVNLVRDNNSSNNNNNNNNVKSEKKIDKLVKLENTFRKDLIKNIHEYIRKSDLDLIKEEDGKVLEIDAKEVINYNKYADCKGKMIVTKIEDKYLYNPDVTCRDTEDDNYGEIKYLVFDGVLLNAFDLGDETALVTSYNHNYRSSKVYYANEGEKNVDRLSGWSALLSIIDKEGNIVIQKRFTSEYDARNAQIEVKNVSKFNGLYHAYVEKTYDYVYSTTSEMDLVVFDKDDYWKSTPYSAALDMRLDNYLGYDDNVYYFADSEKIYRIHENGFTTQTYDGLSDEEGISLQYSLVKYYKGNYYGIGAYESKEKSDGKAGIKELVKLDGASRLLWNKKVADDDFYIASIEVNNDRIYVLNVIEDYNNYDFDYQLSVYDLDGNLIRTFDVNKLFKDTKISDVKLIVTDKPKLRVLLDIYTDSVITFDKDLKKYKQEKTDTSDLDQQWLHYSSSVPLESYDSSREVRVFAFDQGEEEKELVVYMLKKLK